VVIDDFLGNLAVDDFLHLTDRWVARQVWEVKGGKTWLKGLRTIYITSNRDPADWYAQHPVPTQQAVMRRLTTIIHFIKTYDNPVHELRLDVTSLSDSEAEERPEFKVPVTPPSSMCFVPPGAPIRKKKRGR